MNKIFDLRANELRRSAQWVSVLTKGAFILLDCDLFVMHLGEDAAFQKTEDILSRFDLRKVSAVCVAR